MPSSPSSTGAEPIIEVLEDLAPPRLHAAAWAVCSGKNWYYGHSSNAGGGSRFWKMDLDGDTAFDAIWHHVRARCEALAGTPLRVIRQYANGHTYGLGGNPHLDDNRPGTFTLLYYPNPEWQDAWEGETVFYDQAGEIALAVKLRPNRAVFFDSRILHNGRAPSRTCPALRVSVAYKLEAVTETLTTPEPLSEARQPAAPERPVQLMESSREGATRTYRAIVSAAFLQQAVQTRLDTLAKSVSLPGFRAGHVPRDVLEKRYAVPTRNETLKRLAADLVFGGLPAGDVAGSCDLMSETEFRIVATHLPDLAPPDFSRMAFERLTAARPEPEAAALLRERLKLQVLDRLDAAYAFPLLPAFVERELAGIWKAAGPEAGPDAAPEVRQSLAARFRAIAERRVRLGFVIADLARRFEVAVPQGAEMENQVIDRILAGARVEDRVLTPEELAALMKE